MFEEKRKNWGYRVKHSAGNPFPAEFDIFSVLGHGDKCLSAAKRELFVLVRDGFVLAKETRVVIPLKDGWMRLAAKGEVESLARSKGPYHSCIEKDEYIITWTNS